MVMKTFWVLLLGLLTAFLAPGAMAETLLMISGDMVGGNVYITTSVIDSKVYGQWVGFDFTLSQTYYDVSITPTLGYYQDLTPFEGTAWLTTGLPTDTVLASNVFQINNGDPNLVPLTLLSGLTLGPGTYYFLLTGNPGNSGNSGEAEWPQLSNITLTTAAGVTAGTLSFVGTGEFFDLDFPPNSGWYTYPPGNPFNLPILITGDTGYAVPEPTTLVLMLSGMGVIALARRKQLRGH
jgi:hypothetical protein